MNDFLIELEEVKIQGKTFKDERGTKYARARMRIRKSYDVCPLCGKDIREGSVTLITSYGQFLFPNRNIHTACMDKFDSEADMIEFLKNDYDEAMKRKHWFE